MRTGPSLGFGEIRHRRLRPAGNAFRYAGFFLRLPMRSLPAGASGNWLFGIDRPALIGWRRADHGDGGATALAWVERTLAETGVQADGEVWLHTFPRIFGYAFRPVSFWFCHRQDGGLAAVIAEVNNTFGERHCYLLTPPGDRAIRRGETLTADKRFHVSPFNRVEGRYLFRFFDDGERSLARIDYHDDAGPLLITSISGRLQPVTPRACARALLGHPWFTVGVVLRIHWQALKLLAKRVPFVSKPAPPQPFVTRGTP